MGVQSSAIIHFACHYGRDVRRLVYEIAFKCVTSGSQVLEQKGGLEAAEGLILSVDTEGTPCTFSLGRWVRVMESKFRLQYPLSRIHCLREEMQDQLAIVSSQQSEEQACPLPILCRVLPHPLDQFRLQREFLSQ